MLSGVVIDDEAIACRGLFLASGHRPRAALVERVGEGEGVYLAGDLSTDLELAITAAASGARIGHLAHRSLRMEDDETALDQWRRTGDGDHPWRNET